MKVGPFVVFIVQSYTSHLQNDFTIQAIYFINSKYKSSHAASIHLKHTLVYVYHNYGIKVTLLVYLENNKNIFKSLVFYSNKAKFWFYFISIRIKYGFTYFL